MHEQTGAEPTEEIPAFTGLYPLFGGYGNWELLFTRQRRLTRTDNGIQEWTALSHQARGQLLREDRTPHIEVSERRWRYDRLRVAGRQFWVHRRHRQTLKGWTTSQ